MARVFMTGLEMGGMASPDLLFDDINGGDTNVMSGRDPHYGDWHLRMYAVQDGYADKYLDTPVDEIFVRFYVKSDETIRSAHYIFYLLDEDGNAHLRVSATGVVQRLDSGPTWTTIGNCDSLVLDTYECFEVHAVIDGSAGELEIRQDAVSTLSLSGIDTQGHGAAATIGIVRFGGSSNTAYSCNCLYDDIAINDTTGTANNSWIGLGVIAGIRPNAVGDYDDMTMYPGSGEASYEDVDDGSPDDDSTYVEVSASGDRELYEFEDLPAAFDPATQVKAVAVWMYSKMPIPGEGNIAPLLKFLALLWDGDPISIERVSYAYDGVIYEENPVTASSWIVNDLNNSQFGFQEDS